MNRIFWKTARLRQLGGGAVAILGLLALLLFALPHFPCGLLAQDDAAPEAALKYHQALLRRPSPGFLFDRFYGAWLEASTAEQLEAFLGGRVKKVGAPTADRLLLAFFYAKLGNDRRALEELSAVVAADAHNNTGWYELARTKARLADLGGAIDALERALACEPAAPAALVLEMQTLRGRLLVRVGDSEAALQVWRDLLAAHPGDEELAEELIEAQLDEGLLEEAIASSEALVERTADAFLKVQRRLRTGDLYARADNRDKALAAYGDALRQTGMDTWIERQALAQIERLFRQQDDLEGLKKFYADADEDLRRRLQVRLGEAQLLANLGETDNSLTAWREILRLTPGDRQMRERFVRALADAEQYDEALTQIDALIEQAPAASGDLLAARAEVEFSAGRDEQAELSLRLLLQNADAAQNTEALWLRVAKRLQAAQRIDAAEDVLEQAMARWPEAVTVREEYAGVLHRADRDAEAVAVWRALVEQSGGVPAVRLRVARALLAQRLAQAAWDILRAGVETEAGEPKPLAERGAFLEHAGYLTALAEAAEQCGEFERAAHWAREHLLRVTRPDELPAAVELAARMLRKAGGEVAAAEISRLQADGGPASAVQRCLLAELLEAGGDSVAADAVLDDALAKDAADGDQVARDLISAQRVRLLRLRRDWLAAAAATEATLDDGRDGLRSPRLRSMVELLMRAGDLDGALRWLPEWKKASPGNTAPWLEESRILQQAGRNAEAIEVLRRAVQRFDGDATLRAQLAALYAANDDRADAERIYWQLYDAAEKPDEKISWAGRLASLAYDGNSLGQLAEKFEERQRANRQSPLPLLALAELYRRSGDYEKRREALLDATRLRPDDVSLLQVIAGVELDEGEIENARRTLQAAVDIDPTDGSLRRLARFELEHGEDEAGFRILTDLRRRTGAGGLVAKDAAELAWSMVSGSHPQRAIDFLESVAAEGVVSVETAWLKATALAGLQREAEAVEALFQVLEIARDQDWNPPSVTLPAASWARASHDESEMLNLLPPGARLMHRDNGMAYRAFTPAWGGYSPAADRAELESMVLMHLALCNGSPTIAKLEDRAARLETLGVEMALARLWTIWEVQAEVNRIDHNNYRIAPRVSGPPVSVFDRFADDLGVQAIRWSGGFAVTADHRRLADLLEVERVVGLLAEDYPQVACATALNGVELLLARATSERRLAVAESCRPLVARAIELGENLDQPCFALRRDLADRLRSYVSNSSAWPVPQLDGLRGLLLDWHRKAELLALRSGGRPEPTDFLATAAALLAAEGKGPGIDFLEERLRRDQAAGNVGASNEAWADVVVSSRSGFGAVENPLAVLAYPPPELPGFCADVGGLLATADLVSTYRIKPSLAGLTRARLEQVEHPLLRALLAHHSGQVDVEAGAIRELRGRENPTLAELLMIAGKAAQDGDLLASAQALAEARQMPLTAEQRSVVDGALAATVVELSAADRAAAGDAADALWQAGKEATLRFRPWAKQREQRLALLALLEDYGLNEEAERMQRQLDLGRQSVARNRSNNDIGLLVGSGQRDEALRIAERTLRTLAATTVDHVIAQIDWGDREVFDTYWANGLRDELLTRLHPGESDSVRKWMEYAYICHALEDRPAAIDALLRVRQLRPDHSVALSRLIQAHLERTVNDFDAEGLAGVLHGVRNADEVQVVAERWVAATGDQYLNDAPSVKRRQSLPLMVSFLENPPEALVEEWRRDGIDRLLAEKFLQILSFCQSYWVEEDFILHSLDSAPAAAPAADDPAAEFYDPEVARHGNVTALASHSPELYELQKTEMLAAARERSDLFDRLANVLMAWPETRFAAFGRRLQVAEAQGEDLAALEADAWTLVAVAEADRRRDNDDMAAEVDGAAAVAPQSASRRVNFFIRHRGTTQVPEPDPFSGNDSYVVPKEQRPGPEEFLARRAVALGGPAQGEAMAKLIEAMRASAAAEIDIAAVQALAALWAAPDGAQFVAAARSALTDLPAPLAESAAVDGEKDDPRPSAGGVLAAVFEVWRERKLAVDLSPAVLAFFEAKRAGQGAVEVAEPLASWLVVMQDRGGDGKGTWLEGFVAATAEIFVGPKAGREERLKLAKEEHAKEAQQRSKGIAVVYSPLAQLYSAFGRITTEPGVAFALAERIETECPGLPAASFLSAYRNSRDLNWNGVEKRLRGMDWQRSAADFRSYLNDPSDPHSFGSVALELLQVAGQHWDLKGGRAWLNGIDADSFGGGLAHAFLAPETQNLAQPELGLASCFRKYLAEIRAAPLAVQRELAALLIFELRYQFETVDFDELEAVVSWMRQFYRLPDVAELDELLQAESWSDLSGLLDRDGFKERELDFVASRLAVLAEMDEQKAWQVMQKVIMLGGPTSGKEDGLVEVRTFLATALLARPGSQACLALALRALLQWDAMDPIAEEALLTALKICLEEALAQDDAPARAAAMSELCDRLDAAARLALANAGLTAGPDDVWWLWPLLDRAVAEFLEEGNSRQAASGRSQGEADPFAPSYSKKFPSTDSPMPKVGQKPLAPALQEWADAAIAGKGGVGTLGLAERVVAWAKAREQIAVAQKTGDAGLLARAVTELQQAVIDALQKLDERGEAVPGAWMRLQAAENTAPEILLLIGESTAVSGVRALAELWRQPWVADGSSDPELGEACLNAFARRVSGGGDVASSDAQWRAAAVELVDGWSNWLRLREQSRDIDMVIAMTTVALELAADGDETAGQVAARTLRRFGSQLANQAEVISLLVSQRQTDKAARFFLENYAGMNLNYFQGIFSARTQEHLPEFIEALGDDAGLRYFGELVVSLAKDSDHGASGILPREQRVEALARRFADVPFADPELHQRSLELLTLEDAAQDGLREVADAEWRRIHWPGMGHADSGTVQRVFNQAMHRLGDLAGQGPEGVARLADFVDGLERIVARTGQAPNDFLDLSLSYLPWRLLPQLRDMNESEVLAYLPSLHRLVALAEERDSEADIALGMQVLACHFADEAGAKSLADWRAARVGEPWQRWLRGYDDESELFAAASASVAGWDYQLSEFTALSAQWIAGAGERILLSQQWVEVLLHDEWIADWVADYVGKEGIFSQMIETGETTAEEILIMADKLVAASSRGAAQTWLDLSRIAGPEAALEMVDRAIGATTDDAERVRYQVEKAAALIAVGRNDEAQTLLDGVAGEIAAQDRALEKRVAGLRRQIGAAAASDP